MSELNNYSGIHQLLDSEVSFLNYRKWITNKIIKSAEKYSHTKPKKVLEFGAGTGSLSEIYFSITNTKPICLEIDSKLQQLIVQKNLTVRSSISEIREKNEIYDLVFTSNVLEHIENDLHSLLEIRTILKKNGLLIIYVPAHQWLFSDLDKEVGHYRRYSKKILEETIINANYKILRTEYADSLGILASVIIKIFGYKNNLNIGGKTSMRLYDLIFHPISKFIDFITFRKFVGNNLYLVAQKENTK